MKYFAVAAVAAVLALALAPRAPRAADVDRVQRACATLRQQYQGTPDTKNVRHMVKAWGDKAAPLVAQNVVDARVYSLFCE